MHGKPADSSEPSGSPDSEGDGAGSFRRLVDDFYQSAYRFAFSLSGNHHDACDLTQEAFFVAQTNQHQVRDHSKLKQWLFTILRREFLRRRRKEVSHPHSSVEFLGDETPLISVDHAEAIDSQTVIEVMRTLEEGFRVPLALFYFDQLSYREIAEVLELPIGTVMSRLSRGKRLLRERLEGQRTPEPNRIISLHQTKTEDLHG